MYEIYRLNSVILSEVFFMIYFGWNSITPRLKKETELSYVLNLFLAIFSRLKYFKQLNRTN